MCLGALDTGVWAAFDTRGIGTRMGDSLGWTRHSLHFTDKALGSEGSLTAVTRFECPSGRHLCPPPSCKSEVPPGPLAGTRELLGDCHLVVQGEGGLGASHKICHVDFHQFCSPCTREGERAKKLLNSLIQQNPLGCFRLLETKTSTQNDPDNVIILCNRKVCS